MMLGWLGTGPEPPPSPQMECTQALPPTGTGFPPTSREVHGESGIAQANRLVGQYRGRPWHCASTRGWKRCMPTGSRPAACWRCSPCGDPRFMSPSWAAIDPCCRHALRPARCPGLCAASWWLASAEPLATGPLLTGPLARWLARLEEVPVDVDLLPLFRLHLALSLSDALAKTTSPSCGHQGETSVLAPAASGAETGALRDGAADGTGGGIRPGCPCW